MNWSQLNIWVKAFIAFISFLASLAGIATYLESKSSVPTAKIEQGSSVVRDIHMDNANVENQQIGNVYNLPPGTPNSKK